jgi:hypothetical protein
MNRQSAFLTLAVLLALSSEAPLLAQLGSPDTQFWRSGLAGIDSPLEGGARLGAALATGDFDCDGFEDLAIGIPDLDFEIVLEAGGLLVLYGSPAGLVTTGSQFFDQVTPDLPEAPGTEDRFATALASGDFDGDGCADLAVGTPLEDIGAGDDALVDAGMVTVLSGAPGGLVSGFAITQDTASIEGVAESGDHFGAALVAEDFDADGFDDLAVGVPGEVIFAVAGAGAVNVLFGSNSNLTGARDVVFFRGGEGGLPGSPEDGERLGFALAAGNLTVFAGRELAIGCPNRDQTGADDAGEVLVISRVAEANPLTDTLSANFASLPAEAEIEARFGAALAVADFDGDGFGEVAIGVPGQGDGDGAPLDHGAVAVVEIDTISGHWLTQSLLGPDDEEAFDQFGSSLAAADFDADGFADLAIGVPFENLSTLINAGMLHVVPGRVGGFDLANAQTWLQTIDPSEEDDQFAFALATGRFRGGSAADLAIGVPGEQVGAAIGAGAVNGLYSVTLFRDGFDDGDASAWSVVVP